MLRDLIFLLTGETAYKCKVQRLLEVCYKMLIY